MTERQLVEAEGAPSRSADRRRNAPLTRHHLVALEACDAKGNFGDTSALEFAERRRRDRQGAWIAAHGAHEPLTRDRLKGRRER